MSEIASTADWPDYVRPVLAIKVKVVPLKAKKLGFLCVKLSVFLPFMLVMDIPGLRSPFFIRCITTTVTITASLQSGQHIILTPFMIMPIMDLLLVTGMIYSPVALAGIHIVVIATSFPQGLPMVPLVRFTLVVTRSL